MSDGYNSTYGAKDTATPPSSYQPQAPKHQKAGGGGKTFLFGFLGALVACVLFFGGVTLFNTLNGGSGASSSGGGADTQLGAGTNTTITAEDPDETLAEAVAAKALPSVAAIDVYTTQNNGLYSIFGYGYGSSDGELTQSSLGSGVVLSKDGYIITNYHVIEGAEQLKVTVGGERYDAEIIGTDASSDIAVIKVQNATNLTPIELGDSDNLTIGEWVMSIGSPFGLEQSVATGIVSATSRSRVMGSSSYGYGYGTGESGVTYYPNMIQTDAAINPGNSGGALVNADGQLIGINTLITSYSGNYSGVGFAIPVNYAIQLADQIIAGKTPTHAQLGVSVSTVNSAMSQRYGFAVKQGAYVSAVNVGSDAESAGIKQGDIITALDGQAVTSASDLTLNVRTKNPGDTVAVTVNRDGQVMDFQVVLGSDANATAAQSQQSQQSQQPQQNGSLLDLLR